MEVISEKVTTYSKARKVLEDAAKSKELG